MKDIVSFQDLLIDYKKVRYFKIRDTYIETHKYAVLPIKPIQYNKCKLPDKHLGKLKDKKRFPNKIIDITMCESENVIKITLEDNQRIVLQNYIAI